MPSKIHQSQQVSFEVFMSYKYSAAAARAMHLGPTGLVRGQAGPRFGYARLERDHESCPRARTPKIVVDMLVDIVSKNGNLMLNFPLPSSGMLDDRELQVLAGITAWMNVNAARPWKISGQIAAPSAPGEDASFNESKRKPLTAADVRFTTKGPTLYAFVMDWPGKQAVIAPLATSSKQAPGKIENVELLGYPGKLKWQRDETALKIELPAQKPCDHAIAFKISGTGLA